MLSLVHVEPVPLAHLPAVNTNYSLFCSSNCMFLMLSPVRFVDTSNQFVNLVFTSCLTFFGPTYFSITLFFLKLRFFFLWTSVSASNHVFCSTLPLSSFLHCFCQDLGVWVLVKNGYPGVFLVFCRTLAIFGTSVSAVTKILGLSCFWVSWAFAAILDLPGPVYA